MTTTVKRMKHLDKSTLSVLFKRAGERYFEPNQDFFADEKNVLLVSYTNGMLSGFLWAYVLLRPDKRNPKMFLYSIDVFDEFRRQGIASKLIEELKQIAREHRCREMFVPTQKGNVAAMGLFNKTKGRVANEDDVVFIYDEDSLKQ